MRNFMRTLTLLIVAAVFSLGFNTPAEAQLGLEKNMSLRATAHNRAYGANTALLVFSSAIDTIATTTADTTGIMLVPGYTGVTPNLVYTVASGGTVSVEVATRVAPTRTGPWYTVRLDTISATGSSAKALTGFTTYGMPFVQIIAKGIGANDAATRFTALHFVYFRDP